MRKCASMIAVLTGLGLCSEIGPALSIAAEKTFIAPEEPFITDLGRYVNRGIGLVLSVNAPFSRHVGIGSDLAWVTFRGSGSASWGLLSRIYAVEIVPTEVASLLFSQGVFIDDFDGGLVGAGMYLGVGLEIENNHRVKPMLTASFCGSFAGGGGWAVGGASASLGLGARFDLARRPARDQAEE